MRSDTRLTPSGPLAPDGKFTGLIAVGQVVMTSNHGNWQTAWTSGTGYPIGKGQLRPLEEHAKGSLPKPTQEVSEAKERDTNDVEMHC